MCFDPIPPFLLLALSLQVDPAELFFHKFFNLSSTKTKKDKRDEKRARKHGDKDDEEDIEGVDSDDEDIDKMIEGEEQVGLDDGLRSK
jgi:hypothetical protein